MHRNVTHSSSANLVDELFDREDLVRQQTLHEQADAAIKQNLRLGRSKRN
jgi:hypothetical protein